MKRLSQLTDEQIAQLKRDPRVKELHATWLERPLNMLEKIMLKQIVSEVCSNG